MSNLDNFKDIADDNLKNITVSEDLKKRTLQRCKRETSSKRKYMIPSAALGVAAVLTLVMLNSNLLPIGKGTGKDSPQIMMGTAEAGDNTTQINVAENNNKNTKPGDAVSGDNQIFHATEGPNDVGAGQSTEPFEGTGIPLYQPGTIEDANRYMGAEFKTPEYIPSGFRQRFVQVPTDMSIEGMDIMLSFEGGNKHFSVTMRKGATSLDHFTGNKEVDINGAKAQLTSGPLMAETEEVAPAYTQMRWLSNNVLFIIEGQISEEEAVKVGRSIK